MSITYSLLAFRPARANEIYIKTIAGNTFYHLSDYLAFSIVIKIFYVPSIIMNELFCIQNIALKILLHSGIY
jgi:hypothetical protein